MIREERYGDSQLTFYTPLKPIEGGVDELRENV
jgi:hypothetical protein